MHESDVRGIFHFGRCVRPFTDGVRSEMVYTRLVPSGGNFRRELELVALRYHIFRLALAGDKLMTPPPEMRAWLPWSELTGGPRLTHGEYLHALRQFPRSALLIAVARLSILFRYGHDANSVAPDEVTRWVLPQVSFHEHVARVKHGCTRMLQICAGVSPLSRSRFRDSVTTTRVALGWGRLPFRKDVRKAPGGRAPLRSRDGEAVPGTKCSVIHLKPRVIARYRVALRVSLAGTGIDRRRSTFCKRRESLDPAGRYAFCQQQGTSALGNLLNAGFASWWGSIVAGKASGRCQWISLLTKSRPSAKQ